MALTPKAWIPLPGPPTGSQVPEMSWIGAGAAVAFFPVGAPDCRGRASCANASAERVAAANRTVTVILKRFGIFETSHPNFNGNSRFRFVVRTGYASSNFGTTIWLRINLNCQQEKAARPESGRPQLNQPLRTVL